jgi:hypothetical protein
VRGVDGITVDDEDIHLRYATSATLAFIRGVSAELPDPPPREVGHVVDEPPLDGEDAVERPGVDRASWG